VRRHNGPGLGQQFDAENSVVIDVTKHRERVFRSLTFGSVFVVVAFVASLANAATVVVDSTLDTVDASPGDGVCATASGECTLRAALQELRALGADTEPHRIHFSLGTETDETIRPSQPLPPLDFAVVLDATTQPGYEGTPVVLLNGVNAGSQNDGLQVSSPDAEVRGFAIGGFGGAGVSLQAGKLTGCYIGVARDGVTTLPNRRVGVVAGANSQVGPTATVAPSTCENTCNLIAGNGGVGVEVTGSNVQVSGNFIGVARDGLTILPNDEWEVLFPLAFFTAQTGATVSRNRIGSTNPASIGVSYNPDLQPNRLGFTENIFLGSALPIDLGADGFTANDTGDTDVGPNGLLNAPYVASASINGSCDLQVAGFSTAGCRVDLYEVTSAAGSPAAAGRWLDSFVEGEAEDSDGGSGSYSDPVAGSDSAERFEVTLSGVGFQKATRLAATCTNGNGATSEMSVTVEVASTNSDSDDLVDAIECGWGLRTDQADSDDDGLPDDEEFIRDSFGQPVDSDGDGLIDPLDPDDDVDPDADGICTGPVAVRDCTGANDNCPLVANADQTNSAGGPAGDACECGDAIIADSEECDDGNLVGFDGCTASCEVQGGWTCETVNGVSECSCATGDCGRTCYSDEDGDGVTGTPQSVDVNSDCGDFDAPFGTAWTEADGGDCNDSDTNVGPDKQEVCDGIDNDCDELIDDEDPDTTDYLETLGFYQPYYRDSDRDGCGAGAATYFCVAPGEQWSSNALDGSDDDGVCCGNGELEGDEECDRFDVGGAVCPAGTAGARRCDNEADVSSGTCTLLPAAETCSDENVCFSDADGDGFRGTPRLIPEGRSCDEFSSGPADTVWSPTTDNDCLDTTNFCGPRTYPGAEELCDGCDNDCDTSTIDGTDDPELQLPCDSEDADLCEDDVRVCSDGEIVCVDQVNSLREVCNGEDDDCDGLVDTEDDSLINSEGLPGGPTVYYRDADEDGCGIEGVLEVSCSDETPPGFADNALDEDDTDGVCCGNGIEDEGEECDPGLAYECSELEQGTSGLATCSQQCELDTSTCIADAECGDGVLNGNETCDPESQDSPENCRESCTFCGDGIVQVADGESCDPQQPDAPERCRDDCSQCGDGILDEGEECDAGRGITDSCVYGEESCTVCNRECVEASGEVSFCGDGVLDPQFEECDGTTGCAPDCTFGTDSDSDGVVDTEDNCPSIANSEQSDSDSDGIGDACEEASSSSGCSAVDSRTNLAPVVGIVLLILTGARWRRRMSAVRRGHRQARS
jgi:cysteine-rich repeat protein